MSSRENTEASKTGFDVRLLDINHRVVDDDQRLIDYVASTNGVDRYKTRVMNWDEAGLATYMKNPVVLWAHNKTMPPVGRTLAIKQDNGRMLARIQFAPKEVYEFADTIYKLNREGYLSGLSVGFVPQRKEFNEELKCVDLMDNLLYEYSCVPVPGNGDAGRLEHAMRDMSIPQEHQHLLVANYATRARGIEGIDDMGSLEQNVADWAADADYGRAVKVAVPVQFESSTESEPVVQEEEKTAPAAEESVSADVPAEDIVSVLRMENQELADQFARHLKETEGVMRTIAAMVDYDVARIGEADYASELLAAVQGATTRIGSAISRGNLTKLNTAIDALVSIRDSAVKAQSDETEMEDEDDRSAPEDSPAVPDEQRLSAIEGMLGTIASRLDDKTRVDAASLLIEDNARQAEGSMMSQILKRLAAPENGK